MSQLKCRREFVYDDEDFAHIRNDSKHQETLSLTIYETMDPSFGMFIWPSSIVLAEYVWARRELFVNKRVLELGCGQGLPSLVAAKVGAAHVILTDRAHVLPCARHSLELNTLSASTGASASKPLLITDSGPAQSTAESSADNLAQSAMDQSDSHPNSAALAPAPATPAVAVVVPMEDEQRIDSTTSSRQGDIRASTKSSSAAGSPAASPGMALSRRACRCDVAELNWGEFSKTALELQAFKPDILLGADVLYDPDDFDAILATVALFRAPLLTVFQDRGEGKCTLAHLLDKWNMRATLVGHDSTESAAQIPAARSTNETERTQTRECSSSEIDLPCFQRPNDVPPQSDLKLWWVRLKS